MAKSKKEKEMSRLTDEFDLIQEDTSDFDISQHLATMDDLPDLGQIELYDYDADIKTASKKGNDVLESLVDLYLGEFPELKNNQYIRNKMKEDAERNAEADRLAKEGAETRNQLDNFIFSTEKFLSDSGEAVTEDERKTVQGLIDEARKALEAGDPTEMKAAMEKLNGNQELQQIMSRVLQAQAASQGAGPTDGPAPDASGPSDASGKADGPNNDFVDAEVEDVDEADNKK